MMDRAGTQVLAFYSSRVAVVNDNFLCILKQAGEKSLDVPYTMNRCVQKRANHSGVRIMHCTTENTTVTCKYALLSRVRLKTKQT